MNDTVQVTYIYSNAFFECSCGEQVVLSQLVNGHHKYSGSCTCGKEYRLLNGKLAEKPEPQTP